MTTMPTTSDLATRRRPRPARPGTLMAAALLAATMLGGCSILGGSKDRQILYSPQPALQADSSWPSVDWQLTIATVQVARPADSARIAVRPTPQELQVYKDAAWAQRPSELLEQALLRMLEDSGKIPAVSRVGSGVNGDFRLLLDMRRFESDYAGGAVPQAVIEVNAKLLHAGDDGVVASRTFTQSVPASGTAVPEVVQAFEQGLGRVSRDLSGWVLATGQAHRRGHR